MSIEEFFHSQRSRREMFKTAIKTAASGLFVVSQDIPWDSRFWWPIFEYIARKQGIKVLHAYGGPLDVLDKVAREVFDIRTQARLWQENFANKVIREHPETAEWIGYCHGLANTIYLEPKPMPGLYSEEIKVGLLVAKHAADIPIQVKRTEVMSLVTDGEWVVVDYPTVPGRWYRVAYLDGNGRLKATNFGYGDINITVNGIVGAYQPLYMSKYSPQMTVELARLKSKVAGLENPELFDDELNTPVLDYMLTA